MGDDCESLALLTGSWVNLVTQVPAPPPHQDFDLPLSLLPQVMNLLCHLPSTPSPSLLSLSVPGC